MALPSRSPLVMVTAADVTRKADTARRLLPAVRAAPTMSAPNGSSPAMPSPRVARSRSTIDVISL